MKEVGDILRAFEQLPTDGSAALATVVRVRGSAYRSPGARMLIAGGRIIGQVSGGCLERDVVQRAGGVIASETPVLVRYETNNDPENGSGYSLGCGGVIEILIEPLNTANGSQLLRWLAASRSIPLVIATVISKRNPYAILGQRLMVDEKGEIAGTIGQDIREPRGSSASQVNWNDLIVQKAIEVLAGRSTVERFRTAQGDLEVFFDRLHPPLELMIFGAGNDAVPLVELGNLLGWSVRVIDVGSSPLDTGRAWKPDQIIRCGVDQLADSVRVGQHSAAVVMTHNFNHDRKLLHWLSTQPILYLGMLGPKHRTDLLMGDLQPNMMRAPVGLDIGAETPEEIALSIAAEINAVVRRTSGGPLSLREGPIHQRLDAVHSHNT